MKTIALLGSTGSIGTQALSVARMHRSTMRISALSAYGNAALLQAQIKEFKPDLAAVWDDKAAEELRAWCTKNRCRTEIYSGREGLIAVREASADLVISSVVGASRARAAARGHTKRQGHRPGEQGSTGRRRRYRHGPGEEKRRQHNPGRQRALGHIPVPEERRTSKCVKRILLTASGGPFYRSKKNLYSMGADEALAHPTWIMGPKITVDSATLMNKGLEAIEAHHLFGVPMEQHRDRHPSAVDRPFAGRISSTARSSPSFRSRICACRSSTPSPIRSAIRLQCRSST